MRRGLCALVLAVASFGVIAPPAEADTPRCVTAREFRQVQPGMPKRRVHRVFDTRGRRAAFARVGRVTSESRHYRPCRRRTAIAVAFHNHRLSAKAMIRR
jgi:hypothetical protein